MLALFLALALAAVPLYGASGSETGNAILMALAPLIVAVVAPLIARLFRKLGLDITDGLIEPILMRIIEIITSVEKEAGLDGAQKKMQVIQIARGTLAAEDIRLLEKKYGSLETAVQAAFERSSVARKDSPKKQVK
jgi:hypothetical protein